MTNDNESYKALLDTALAAIQSELAMIATQNPKTGDWVAVPEKNQVGNADANVAADITEEWNERRALMADLETRYRNIVRALKKFEEETYGICEISGEPIEPERLAVNPAARTNMAHVSRELELPL